MKDSMMCRQRLRQDHCYQLSEVHITQSNTVLKISASFILHICPAGGAAVRPVERSQLLSNGSITGQALCFALAQRQGVDIFLYTLKQGVSWNKKVSNSKEFYGTV